MTDSKTNEVVEAMAKRKRKGWLYRAVEPFLPDWNKYDDKRVSAPTVCGEPDEWNDDPRFTAKEWLDNDGNLTLGMLTGKSPEGAGLWVMQTYTPEQCVQVVAAILSKPAMEKVVGPLLAALTASEPLLARAQAVEDAARLRRELEAAAHNLETGDRLYLCPGLNAAAKRARAFLAQSEGEGKA